MFRSKKNNVIVEKLKNKFSSTIISRSGILLRSLSLHLQFCICLLHCIYILVWLLQILPFSLCMCVFFVLCKVEKKFRELWHFFLWYLENVYSVNVKGLTKFLVWYTNQSKSNFVKASYYDEILKFLYSFYINL